MKQGKVNLKNNFFSARRKQTLLAKKRKKARKLGLTTRAPFPEDLKDLFEHYQKGRIDTAISLGFSITENFPHHPIAWRILGASLLQAGRMEEGLAKAAEFGNDCRTIAKRRFHPHFNGYVTMENPNLKVVVSYFLRN